jgi:hypothetical protein
MDETDIRRDSGKQILNALVQDLNQTGSEPFLIIRRLSRYFMKRYACVTGLSGLELREPS